jgi:hypothetical protein
MRYLILFLLTFQAWGRCENLEKVASLLNTQEFLKSSRKAREVKKELTVAVGDVNQARSLVYNFPALRDLGFGLPDQRWHTSTGRLEKSNLFGKVIGREISNEKGFARVRIDWDPAIGAHYNIEIFRRQNDSGKSEHHSFAVTFPCNGKPCSQAEVTKLADKLH